MKTNHKGYLSIMFILLSNDIDEKIYNFFLMFSTHFLKVHILKLLFWGVESIVYKMKAKMLENKLSFFHLVQGRIIWCNIKSIKLE